MDRYADAIINPIPNTITIPFIALNPPTKPGITIEAKNTAEKFAQITEIDLNPDLFRGNIFKLLLGFGTLLPLPHQLPLALYPLYFSSKHS